MKISLLVFFFFVINVNAFVFTKTIYDRDLKWQRTNIDFLIDPIHQNQSTDITPSLVSGLTNHSFVQWQNYTGNVFVNTRVSTNPHPLGSGNSLRFSNDPTIFGSGVLAVTSINHSASSGEIFSADIIINDTFSNSNSFSALASATGGSKVYIGDVISHEVGHFFGLGHSDVPGSTMTFSVFKDQASIHDDDIRGVANLYGQQINRGEIRGIVSGGGGIGVFATQVQAISLKNGKVISAVLTEENGSFILNNLPVDDSYILYILPPRDVSHLPEYYRTAQVNYCNRKSYVPSFFTKCGARERGYPQVIDLRENESRYVGDISIRCGESISSEYLLNKTRENREVFQLNGDGPQVFTGYFNNEEITDNIKDLKDKLRIDLSGVDNSQGNITAEIRILVSEIGSNMGLTSLLTTPMGNSLDFPTYDSLNKLEVNNFHQMSLSTNSAQNIWELEINPREISSTDSRGIFARADILTNTNATYVVIINLIKPNNSGIIEYISKEEVVITDNSSCRESTISIETSANTPFTSNIGGGGALDPTQSVTCGTVDIDNNGGPSGGLSFMLGLLMSLTLFLFQRKKNDFFV